jgi:VirE N-terminal domain
MDDGQFPSQNGILDTLISLFKNVTSTDNPEVITIANMLSRIKNGHYHDEIARVRSIRHEHGKEAYTQAKKQLPAATFGGTFTRRSNQALQTASGIATIDMDGLGGSLIAVRERLHGDPCLAGCFVTPSADGLKALYRIPAAQNDAEYKRYWHALARYVEATHDVQVDPSGKDISRLALISYDPNLFMRDDAEIFTDCDPEPASNPPRVTPATPIPIPTDDRERERERVIKTAQDMLYASAHGNRHHTRIKVGKAARRIHRRRIHERR